MSPYRSMTAYSALPAPAPAFTLADLIALVQARRTLILRVALGTIALTALIAFVLPTTWSSSVVVMLDPRRNTVTDVTAVLSQLTGDPATLQNQVQILNSRELAAKVVSKLQLENDPEFNPTLARPGLVEIGGEMIALLNPRNWFDDGTPLFDNQGIHDRVVDNFLRHVSAEANGLSTAITLTVTARNAGKAARIANTMSQLYIAGQVDEKRGAANTTTAWLNQRLHDLSQQLQLQEGAVQTYKAEHGLTDTAPGTSLVDQQLVGINTQLVQARSDLAEKQATADRINTLVRSGNAADVSSVVSSPLIVQLRTQAAQMQRDESDLSSKYGPLHPKLQALEAEKRDLDTKIAEEVRRIAGAAANDVTVARAHLNSLEGSLGGARQQFTGENYARVALQALQSNADATRVQYEAFVTQLRQVQDQDGVQLPESRIISPAAIPRDPSGPRRSLIIGASIPFGLLLGLLVAMMQEKFGFLWPAENARVSGNRLTPRPRAAAKVVPMPPWNGPPILAQIGDAAALKAGDYVLDFPKSRYANRMTALARQLESRAVNGQDAGAAVVVITAAEPGENKSAIGISLARTVALQGKRVLLIDCDPMQSATRTLRAPARDGLLEVLTGAVPLNQAFAKDARSNAYVLAMPKRPPDLPAMFGSLRMEKLIQVLRGGCDMVVIDCASAGAGSEAALMARLADATLMVCRHKALYAPPLAKSVKFLNRAHAAPIGIVVTK